MSKRNEKVGTTFVPGQVPEKRRDVSVSTLPPSTKSSSKSVEKSTFSKICGPFNMPPMEKFLDIVIIFFAELFGTWFLIFLLCSGMLVDNVNKVVYGLSYGVSMVVVVQIFGHISFCNLNPAISIAAVILGHYHILMLPIYLISQILGAISGAFTYYVLCPWSLYRPNNCNTKIGPGVSGSQAFIFEFLLTGIYTLAYAVAFEKRLAFRHDSLALRFGLILMCVSMAGYEFTGCSINPVRSLGPALVEGYWKNHWVYWIGPILGSIAFSFIYRVLFRDRYDEG